MSAVCALCSADGFHTVYDGPIRGGGVGAKLVDGYEIVECGHCGLQRLSPFPERRREFYESDEYREHFDATTAIEDLARRFDPEQGARLQRIGVENIRGRKLGDFGAGAGLFLDVVRGIAAETVAVEPMRSFEPLLRERGHRHCSYPTDVPQSSLEVATCFDTLEHIDDPVGFLEAIHEALAAGGVLYLSLPNRDDILMHVAPDAFRPFFYCTVHLFYYALDHVAAAVRRAGFEVEEASGLHKYDFFNFVGWVREGVPRGRAESPLLDRHFDRVYESELIRLGRSSHHFLRAVKR